MRPGSWRAILIALAALLLFSFPAQTARANTHPDDNDWPDLGLLAVRRPGQAALPLCRTTWLAMLNEAFGVSPRIDKARPWPGVAPPARLPGLLCRSVGGAEATASLADVTGIAADAIWSADAGSDTEACRHLTLAMGASAIRAALALLPIATPPAEEPAQVVRAYYRALGDAIASPVRTATSMATCCCGSALDRLRRNLPALGEGTAFRLVSLQVTGVTVSGHLAQVAVRRTADMSLGGRVQRTTADDIFYLRHTRLGWRIYR